MPWTRARLLLPTLLLLATMPGQLPARDMDEDEPVLAAAELAQAALLSGPGFHVLPQVPISGFMARFTVQTRNGPMLAESVELLEVRNAEMAALDILERTEVNEAFGIAVRESLTDTAGTLVQIVTHPVETVAGLPAGVLRYFQQQTDKFGNRLRRHGDRVAYKGRNDGDPYDMVGPMNASRAFQPQRPRKRWFNRLGREVGRQAEDYVSHGRNKRMLARELGIDPYAASTNAELDARLDRLAWAAAVGSLGIDAALGQLPRGGRETLSQGNRLNDLVWELEPADLRRRNHEVMERWCADEFQMRRFLRHGVFLASVQTRFVDALDAIAPSTGCESVLDLALAAKHEVEARYLTNALVMAADYYGDAIRGAELLTLGAGLALRMGDGRLVLPLPVDHLSWTSVARQFFRQDELTRDDRVLLVAGGVSDRSLRELTALGWEIVVRTPFAGAPAYARRCCA